jgi:hypothetical protein
VFRTRLNVKLNKLFLLVFILSCSSVNLLFASTNPQNETRKPRYASGVVSIIQNHEYLRTHDAPTYWQISPYYLPQSTDASCSSASAAMVINALRIPQMRYANQKLATAHSVVHRIQNNVWADDVKQGAEGVSLDQLGSFLKQAIKAYHIPPIQLEIMHAIRVKSFAKNFHQALLEGEKTGRTFIIVNFNQKLIGGTESVGHFAPVGAYDAKTKRVLIMDPDRELFEPYWVSEHRLVESMETKDSGGVKNRGFIIVKVLRGGWAKA